MVRRPPLFLQILRNEVRCVIYFSACMKQSGVSELFWGFLGFISVVENFSIYLRFILKTPRHSLSLLHSCFVFPLQLRTGHIITPADLFISVVFADNLKKKNKTKQNPKASQRSPFESLHIRLH